MAKTIFIITGFKDKASDSQYKWMRTFFKKKGFIVKIPSIKWNHRVMSDYVDEFRQYYEENKSEKNYVLGFSYGAMIAFISAHELKPAKLYLCSLSPYFNEDLRTLKPWWKRFIGIHRLNDFKQYIAKSIAKNLAIPTVVFYGTREAKRYPELKVRCEETSKLAPKAKLVSIKDAPHRVDHPEYVEAIKKEFA